MTTDEEKIYNKPASLSKKKKKQASGKGTITDEVMIDSDESDSSRRSVGSVRSTSTTSSFASGAVKRKRGAPPTTGEYLGYAKAKQEAAERERELMEALAEREVAEMECEVRTTRVRSNISIPNTSVSENLQADLEDIGNEASVPEVESITALRKRIKGDLDMVTMVATKSSNLKNNYVKYLKDAAKSINAAVEILLSRSAREENIQLEKENRQLRKSNETLKVEVINLKAEIKEMRKMITEMRKDILQGRPTNLDWGSAATRQFAKDRDMSDMEMEIETEGKIPNKFLADKEDRPKNLNKSKSVNTNMVERQEIEENQLEHLAGKIMSQVGNMINARLEALEGRLLPEVSLRPKLMSQAQTQVLKQQSTKINKRSTVEESATYAKVAASRGQLKKDDTKGPEGSSVKKIVKGKSNASRAEPERSKGTKTQAQERRR